MAACALLILMVAACPGAAAQGGGKPAQGNPTPGTPQPEPPNLADRVTLTGCVRPAPGRPGAAADPNTPTDTRFVLTDAQRRDVTPAGTGGSESAAQASGRTFRLEAIESQLSPFVDAKVEVSGEVRPRPAASRGQGVGSNIATIQVEFVRRIAGSCP
jgi:hypothetical protein